MDVLARLSGFSAISRAVKDIYYKSDRRFLLTFCSCHEWDTLNHRDCESFCYNPLKIFLRLN